jgi:hypothetical protein
MLEHIVERLASRIFTSLEPLISETRRLRLLRLDPWRNSNRSDLEQAEFKTALLSFYECAAPEEASKRPMARCMVSNQVFPQPVVIASHIWKYCTGGSGLDEFGLRLADLHSPRNGLLLASEIEEELQALEPIAKEIAALVGYQKLALTIIGGLKVPVSKKKEPMDWAAILDLVSDIRRELGIQHQ